MATSTVGKTRCIKCGKEKATLKCGGCFQDFCYNHWDPHRQELSRIFDEIDQNRDTFRQTLIEHLEKPNNYGLVQQINQWKEKSMRIIEQMAKEATETVLGYRNKQIEELEMKLNQLTKQLRESREENDFNEVNLQHFQEELEKLTAELNKPPGVSIEEEPVSFITKISVDGLSSGLDIDQNAKWLQNGVTAAGGNGQGNQLNQLNGSVSFYMDDDHEMMYVADRDNHRIVRYKYGETQGRVVAGGNGKGNQMNQFAHPAGVILDPRTSYLLICDLENRRVLCWSTQYSTNGHTLISNIDCCRAARDRKGFLYVSDYKKQEVRRWKIGDQEGRLVAGGNGQGSRLDQLNVPTFIFVDNEDSVYVSDSDNNRVMKWKQGAKEGVIVAGAGGKGDGLTQLNVPQGLFVDSMGTVYVADSNNHRVMRWSKEANQGTIAVGGNGPGNKTNQLRCPFGLSFDRQGNLYVADRNNHRIQRFNIDQR